MQQKHMWVTLSVSIVYVVIAMAVMIGLARNRVVTIEDVTQGQMLSDTTWQVDNTRGGTWKNLMMAEVVSHDKDIVIPLEQVIKSENVVVENHYMDQELWIGLGDLDKGFYAQHAVEWNAERIDSAVYGKQKGMLWLKFKLNGMYESQSILEGDHLCIQLVKPNELYDKVVVVDPWYTENASDTYRSGMTEAEITLDIARRIEEFVSADKSMKVYYTRTDDEMPTLQERQMLVSQIEPDFYIGIALNESEDVTMYGVETVYNGTYFVPEVSSIELADSLTRNVTTNIIGRANGLVEATQTDTMVRTVQVPAAFLKVGYMSNEKEWELLNQAEYRTAVARGIVNSLDELYEKMGGEQ